MFGNVCSRVSLKGGQNNSSIVVESWKTEINISFGVVRLKDLHVSFTEQLSTKTKHYFSLLEYVSVVKLSSFLEIVSCSFVFI